jgi:hypothetical protein
MNQDPKDFQDIKDNLMIVKGRFKAASINLFGQFILIYKNRNEFDTFNAVISTYSDLYNLEPHEEWTKYREYISNVKWKGNFNASMTSSIMEHLKKFSEEMNSISLLYDIVCDYDYNAMDATLFDLINRIIHDKTLILETAIQEITPSEFRAAVSGNDAKSGTEDVPAGMDSQFAVEDDAVILSVKPIVAPVRGKPIYELRIGDKLMVYLQPQSDRANYFIDLLGLREDKEIKATPGEVIDIKAGSGKNNPTDILTLISPGIYGKFTETEKQVKLKMYNPEIDGPMAKKNLEAVGGASAGNSESSARKFTYSKGTIVMLVLFILILVLLVVWVIVS